MITLLGIKRIEGVDVLVVTEVHRQSNGQRYAISEAIVAIWPPLCKASGGEPSGHET